MKHGKKPRETNILNHYNMIQILKQIYYIVFFGSKIEMLLNVIRSHNNVKHNELLGICKYEFGWSNKKTEKLLFMCLELELIG